MDVRKKKMRAPFFPVLFAADAGYAPHLASALFSLLQNNKSLQIRVIVFTAALPKQDEYKLQKLCDRFEVSLDLKYLEDKWFDGLILNHHFRKSNYYRLFASDLIDDDKCLYLDADIIVSGSISEIINAELDRTYLAAVENPGFNRHKELGMTPGSKYFNSGVMLLNLGKWRSADLKERVISFVKEKPEAIHFVDQCGLNGVVDGEWVELDAKYNYQSSMLSTYEFESCINHQIPVVVHYTGSSKPWHLNNTHPYKKLYWHYRNQTPYKSFLSDDFSLSNVARFIAPNSVKKVAKNIIGTKLK